MKTKLKDKHFVKNGKMYARLSNGQRIKTLTGGQVVSIWKMSGLNKKSFAEQTGLALSSVNNYLKKPSMQTLVSITSRVFEAFPIETDQYLGGQYTAFYKLHEVTFVERRKQKLKVGLDEKKSTTNPRLNSTEFKITKLMESLGDQKVDELLNIYDRKVKLDAEIASVFMR